MDEEFEITHEKEFKFFGQEYWKISSYISTIMPTFFLSVLVGLVEYSPDDFSFVM